MVRRDLMNVLNHMEKHILIFHYIYKDMSQDNIMYNEKEQHRVSRNSISKY